MKLTEAQIRVLKALAEPGAVAHFMTGLNAYWFLSNRNRSPNPATIHNLERKGLIIINLDSLGYSNTATITQAGREYLAQMEGVSHENF